MAQIFQLLGIAAPRTFLSQPVENELDELFIDAEEIILLEFDATRSQTHKLEADVTSHPVETGADITDHIRKKQETLSLSGTISNTPILFLASFQAKLATPQHQGDPRKRAEAAYDYLRVAMGKGQTFAITTSLRHYRQMALVSVSCVRDASSGNVVNLDLEFIEVIRAETRIVGAPRRKRGSGRGKKKGKGKQGTTDGDSLSTDSLLSRIFSFFGAG